MRYLYFIIIILMLFPGYSLASNEKPSKQKNDEDTVIDKKYEKEYLYGIRDEFIEKHGDLLIGGLIIKGIKKTSSSVIVQLSGIETGSPISSFDPYATLNRLKKKNIFSEIDISYTEQHDNAIVKIAVEEKWTLIPLPFFPSNRNGWKFGFFLMESNLFGYAKSVFAGGSYSSYGSSGMLGYIDPSIANTGFAGNIFISYKKEIYQNSNLRNKIYREYKAAKEMCRIDLGYAFSDSLRCYVSGGYEMARVDASYEDSLNMPDDAKSWLTGTMARYESLSHYEYLFYGTRIELSCFRHVDISGNHQNYNSFKGKFEYSFSIWNYDRLSLSSNGFIGNRPPILEETIGGKPGGRTLPADMIAASDYINYTLTYEYPFLKYKWGYITLLVLWEHGAFSNSNTDKSYYYGPGAGVMLYLKRIAFPAMGFNIANNLQTNSTEFSVNIGAQF